MTVNLHKELEKLFAWSEFYQKLGLYHESEVVQQQIEDLREEIKGD